MKKFIGSLFHIWFLHFSFFSLVILRLCNMFCRCSSCLFCCFFFSWHPMNSFDLWQIILINPLHFSCSIRSICTISRLLSIHTTNRCGSTINRHKCRFLNQNLTNSLFPSVIENKLNQQKPAGFTNPPKNSKEANSQVKLQYLRNNSNSISSKTSWKIHGQVLERRHINVVHKFSRIQKPPKTLTHTHTLIFFWGK